jgi:maltokinase
MSDDRLALIIACSEYEDPGLRRLRTPAEDARALEDVLKDPAIGDFNVKTVLNEPDHIVKREIDRFLTAGRPGDLLLLYFSCHGLKDDAGELYFAATSTELPHLHSTAVDATFVKKLLDRSPSQQIVLLMDCCYSGAFASGMVHKGTTDVDIQERFSGTGRVVITASSAMEYAFEGRHSSGQGEGSVFTRELVAGLRTGDADLDKDGRISIGELYQYVYSQVRQQTPNQRPLKWDFGIGDDLALARSPRPTVVTQRDQPPQLSPDLLRAMQSTLAVAVIPYLQEQRWYSGRGRSLQRVQVQLMAALSGGSPALVEVIVAAIFADGGVERYQVPCGLWTGEGGPSFAATHPNAQIGSSEWSGRRVIIYDAIHDPALGPVLLEHLAHESSFGDLRFHLERPEGDSPAELEVDSPAELRANASRLLSGEQTNSSLVYDDRFILKLFRRLHDGLNPELEMHRLLAKVGFTAIAKPLGWIDGPGSTLGVLQPYYPGSATGWEVAVPSVDEAFDAPDRELSSLQNDFAPHASHLGTLTADMHIALTRAQDPVIAEEADLAQTNQRMRAHLHEVIAEIPRLEQYRQQIEELFNAAERAATRLQLQRIHGDYHLNQVLRTGDGDWLVIDFEGEPVRSLEERRRLYTPLRDVAGMLRSFDYVASYPLHERPDLAGLELRAREWTTRNQTAFLDSYLERAGRAGLLPDEYGLVLLACEADKAVYEVRYDTRYRPTWLEIPFQGIERLIASYQGVSNTP